MLIVTNCWQKEACVSIQHKTHHSIIDICSKRWKGFLFSPEFVTGHEGSLEWQDSCSQQGGKAPRSPTHQSGQFRGLKRFRLNSDLCDSESETNCGPRGNDPRRQMNFAAKIPSWWKDAKNKVENFCGSQNCKMADSNNNNKKGGLIEVGGNELTIEVLQF